jgi:hypothetical protein
MSSMRCVGSVRRATIQSISRSLFHWKPLADALDAKVQSSDLFCERLITGDGKRFVVHADEKLTALLELESQLSIQSNCRDWAYGFQHDLQALR